MSFFKKMKQGVGIGVGKLTLTADPTLTRDMNEVKGSISLTCEDTQRIKDIKVVLEETYYRKTSDGQTQETFDLGEMFLEQNGFDMQPGETKQFEFTLPFQFAKSGEDRLAEMGGVLGSVGKLGQKVLQKSKYELKARADVEGAMASPDDSVQMQLH